MRTKHRHNVYENDVASGQILLDSLTFRALFLRKHSAGTCFKKSPAGSLTLGDFLKQANIARSPKLKDVLKKQYECKK